MHQRLQSILIMCLLVINQAYAVKKNALCVSLSVCVLSYSQQTHVSCNLHLPHKNELGWFKSYLVDTYIKFAMMEMFITHCLWIGKRQSALGENCNLITRFVMATKSSEIVCGVEYLWYIVVVSWWCYSTHSTTGWHTHTQPRKWLRSCANIQYI